MNALDPELSRLVAEHDADPESDGAAAAARRGAIFALHAAGRLQAPAAQFAAARVLLAGEGAAEVELAQTLALRAMGSERAARRLAACAYDRLRRLAGKPQKFGTEIVAGATGPELWPVEASTTDSERAKWNVEPLAELQRHAVAPPRR